MNSIYTHQKRPHAETHRVFHQYYSARDDYFPSSVLIVSKSPLFTKKGTCTTKPVSIVAGFEPPLAVSPLIPGSVSVTSKSTVFGKSIPKISPLYSIIDTSIFSFKNLSSYSI